MREFDVTNLKYYLIKIYEFDDKIFLNKLYMSKFSFQIGDQVLRIISVLRDGFPSIIISA
jgi:hypothetical protein